MGAVMGGAGRVGATGGRRFSLRKFLGLFGPFDRAIAALNYQIVRDKFIAKQLSRIPADSLILDAGCGSQPYRPACDHLRYRSQDFGQFEIEEKKSIFSHGDGGKEQEQPYSYGRLDYVGDIWDIKEQSETFDAILCSEVFEHIPYPIETLKEFSRLLKKGGVLIMTTPSNCIRHMDPFFFYNGFSDRWFEKFCRGNGLTIEILHPVGDYYRHHLLGLIWTAKFHSFLAKLVLLPAILYFYCKKPTVDSVNTLCLGYYVVARRTGAAKVA